MLVPPSLDAVGDALEGGFGALALVGFSVGWFGFALEEAEGLGFEVADAVEVDDAEPVLEAPSLQAETPSDTTIATRAENEGLMPRMGPRTAVSAQRARARVARAKLGAYAVAVAEARRSPYRTHAKREHARWACPACAGARSCEADAVCTACGLSWIAPGSEFGAMDGGLPNDSAAPSGGEAVGVCLRVRPSLGQLVSWLTMVLVGAFGVMAAGSAAWDALPAGSDLVLLLLVVPVGAWITVWCVACIVECALHTALPSRVDGDTRDLRVRVWRRWTGALEGLGRTDVRIPREEILGVGLQRGPLGQAELFVLHASGYAFGTGWRGSEEDGRRLALPIARWVTPRAAIPEPLGPGAA